MKRTKPRGAKVHFIPLNFTEPELERLVDQLIKDGAMEERRRRRAKGDNHRMKASKAAAPRLSEKFAKAFDFARDKHEGQRRKGTAIPYLSHPMAVASIVLEYGGSEEQAIGALLHDVVEDCHVSPAEIAERFGETVSRIVKDCTDAAPKPGKKKPKWRPRKERYIAHVRQGADPRSLLVSAADKLHNAHAIVRDVKDHGPETWKRFKGKKPSDILWYYESLVSAFRDRAADVSEDFGQLVAAIDAAVKEMRKLSKSRQE